MSISQLVLVSRETRTVLFCNHPSREMVDRKGKPWESSSSAQIRTLFDEQRQMIIAEHCEKIGHHELQVAQAEEEERRILQEELWRQKLEFREVHQQSLTEMKELRKFQNLPSIRSQDGSPSRTRTLLWNYQGVQELQNEVNCMNDSKEFQGAESVRSGNSHVTSQPMSFPAHPIPERMLRHSFVSPRR